MDLDFRRLNRSQTAHPARQGVLPLCNASGVSEAPDQHTLRQATNSPARGLGASKRRVQFLPTARIQLLINSDTRTDNLLLVNESRKRK